jgi:hypothetical protein
MPSFKPEGRLEEDPTELYANPIPIVGERKVTSRREVWVRRSTGCMPSFLSSPMHGADRATWLIPGTPLSPDSLGVSSACSCSQMDRQAPG